MGERRGEHMVADFDSASAMLRSLSRFLRGKDTPVLGQLPKALERPAAALARGVERAPPRLKEKVYTWSGWYEAVQKHEIARLRAEDLSRWATAQYPDGPFPGVFLGSANGAAVHLAAMLGMPWLPQTLLVPVRRHGVPPDDPRADLEQMIEVGQQLVANNPDLQLHHMHDANQDRLMIAHMTYFRLKQRTLGESYRRFLLERLEPGAPIVLVECTLRWPGHTVSEGYVFQHGAPGGAEPQEFQEGSERVAEYLERYGSDRRSWDYPPVDAEHVEAEWGFEPALRAEVEAFARERGHPLLRLVFEDPEELSPLVADLYRERYAVRHLRANRLLVESFLLVDPYRTFATGSVPFWSLFNKEPSLRSLSSYLDSREAFDEIFLLLFSHGVESVGLPPIEEWQAVVRRARRRGEVIGFDEDEYPLHFGVLANHGVALDRRVRARYPLPGPLPYRELLAFLARAGERYRVSFKEREAPGRGPPSSEHRPSP